MSREDGVPWKSLLAFLERCRGTKHCQKRGLGQRREGMINSRTGTCHVRKSSQGGGRGVVVKEGIRERKASKRKRAKTGTSLVGQWLRLRAPSARALGSIPGQRTRSHMHAPTKTWLSQIRK